jgi:TonB family protein
MRNALLGSGAVHVGLIVALALGRGHTSIVVPGPDVVQVSLLDPTAAPTPVAPQPEPKVEPKPATIKPTDETGVKLQPEKPKPKPPVKEEPRQAPPPAAPSLAVPSAAVGNAGLRGDVSVDAGNFEFTYYLLAVRNKIAANWTAPAGVGAGGAPVRVVVYFRITRDGELASIRVETGSALEAFDRSAVRAVTLSDPMPPLPLGFTGSDLGVHFGFDWVAP